MTPPALRDYQLDVVERCRARLREGAKRVLVQAPTGAGKTHISSEICRAAVAKGKRCLFLAHRRRLIAQKSERLDAFGVPHGIVMAGQSMWRGAPVQVASRDTLLSRAVRNDWIEPPPADVVIVDEAHNCLSGEYQALLARYREAVIIGLTATPARSDGKGLGSYYQALECSVPVSRLVRDGWLVPVRCYAPVGRKADGDKPKLVGDPVSNWRQYGSGRPTVLFAAKVAASRAARQAFDEAGVPAEHIDAHTPDGEREAIVRRLKRGETRVVCNVGVWTEGVDVPELSCCILLRMAGSYVLYAQAVGRVMRAHPSKADAVLIDHAGAVFRHGFPDEDVEWSLQEDEAVDRRIQRDKDAGKRKEPICCPACAFLFSGQVQCPACGHRLQPRRDPQPTERAALAEVTRRASPEELREQKVRHWHTCLRVMACKGRTTGAAAQMYRGRFGEWPPHDFPNMPHRSQWRMRVADLFPQYLRSHRWEDRERSAG